MQLAVATGLVLLLFVLVANLVLVQYARAALRATVEEAARAGAAATSAAIASQRCAARADDAVGDLLGGELVGGLDVACAVGVDRVVARASGTVAAWLPLYPAFAVDAEATVVREVWP